MVDEVVAARARAILDAAARTGAVTGDPAPTSSGSRPADVRRSTVVGRYLDWLQRERGLEFETYDDLWQWSVDDLDGFWSSIWSFFDVRSSTPYDAVVRPSGCPGPSGSPAPS